MKPCVHVSRMSRLLVMSATLLLTLQTASARGRAEQMPAAVQVEINKKSDTGLSPLNAADPVMENKDRDLLNEILQSDSPDKSEQSAQEESSDHNARTPEKDR